MKHFMAVAAVCFMVFAVACAKTKGKFPSEPITYVIPFNPGGQSDLEARRQQPLLERTLGVKVIIQYKDGGGGSAGWADLVRQKTDGYIIAGINVPHIILQPLARGDAGYKTEQIVPIAFFQTTPIGLAVLKDSPFKTLKDLIEFAREKPDEITIAGSGTWSGHHIAHLQLQDKAGIRITYIPHKGAAPSVAAFLGRHVMALWGNSNDLFQHKEKIRVLAFGTVKPFPAMPNVPTFKSHGYNIEASIDRGVGVPKGTPNEVISVLEKAFLSIANDPKIRRQMLNEGFEPMSLGSAESKRYIEQMIKEWAPIVKKYKK